MINDLIYIIPKDKHSEEDLKKILTSHPEIKFVSLVGIDLSGNDTDEKIPINIFINDITKFLKGSIQTDGSSVVLPGIATLNNAKVDMLADTNVNWFIDYNYEHIDVETNKPIGTLRIPCFLYHEQKAVDSRHILKNSIEYFKSTLLKLFKKYPESLSYFGINYNDIDSISATSATELEFWVKTPNDKAETEELSTSQVLQEQYWKRTKGDVRTCLEECLLIMEKHGLSPEMGHKEVGGVKAKIDESGKFTHIMEQLEIDWKYSDALQVADNELLVRTLIKETFRRNGLDVTFMAKPIDEIAGSGKHIHISVSINLKNGKKVNLFAPKTHHYLSPIGYSSIMGVLKNYEVVNSFISATNDSLRRLRPGFEAPTCIVTSIGHSVELPSRNRTVLIGVIRDLENPLSTRFELRSPCPHTNTYLAIASIYMSIIDGISYAITNLKSDDDLLKELSKKPGEEADYLEKQRAYRSEEDVFEDFNDEEREKYFGKAPSTVYENISVYEKYPQKVNILKANDVFTDSIINSFKLGTLKRWLTEINNRIIANYSDEIRSYKMLHSIDKALDLDVSNWMKINEIRHFLMKDSYTNKSLFTKIKEATKNNNYKKVSQLQLKLDKEMKKLRELYSIYKKNLLDI